MIKVIKPGDVYVKACPRCNAIFTYQAGDTNFKNGFYPIECPECHDTGKATFDLWDGARCPDCQATIIPASWYCYKCGRKIPKLEDYKL